LAWGKINDFSRKVAKVRKSGRPKDGKTERPKAARIR
jgi:hypothetical protein